MATPRKPNPMSLSDRGKLAAKKSPWGKSAMAVGWKAARSHREYQKKGKPK